MDHLDRRTIEHAMTRAAGRVPPKPMSYLQVCLVMETAGKQRRQRFYTWEHYRALLRSQKLNDDRFDHLNDDHRDDFMEIKREQFYTTEQELVAYEKAISDGKKVSLQRDSATRKKRPGKNPVVNGVRKKGRPRKEYPPGEEPKRRKRQPKVVEGGDPGEEKARKPRKRKADEMEGGDQPVKEHPSKKRNAHNLPATDAASTSLASVQNSDPIQVANGATSSQPLVAAPAAIPVAHPTIVPGVAALAFVSVASSPVAGPSRKRGRPRKSQVPNEAPAPKKPRKSKQATEPIPESNPEQVDTVASAVLPAPEERQASNGIPQATAGERSAEEVTAPVLSVSPPADLQHATETRRYRGRSCSLHAFNWRIRSPWQGQESSDQHHRTCWEDSNTACSTELIRGQYCACEGILYFNSMSRAYGSVLSGSWRTAYRSTIISFSTTD